MGTTEPLAFANVCELLRGSAGELNSRGPTGTLRTEYGHVRPDCCCHCGRGGREGWAAAAAADLVANWEGSNDTYGTYCDESPLTPRSSVTSALQSGSSSAAHTTTTYQKTHPPHQVSSGMKPPPHSSPFCLQPAASTCAAAAATAAVVKYRMQVGIRGA